MITGEDIDRCKDEKQGLQLVVIDVSQYFEFEIPVGDDPEEFVNSHACRFECALQIMNQTTDLSIDRVLKQYDEINEEWVDVKET